MYSLGLAIELVLYLFILFLLGRLVADWIQMFAREWTPRGPLLVVLEVVYTVTDPPIKALRRILPPLRLGGMLIDLSFFVVLLIAYLLRVLNRSLLL
ncbi:YggT family protein [Nocardioides terrisoli]|uniref:YggT family protein n=1 Tax=Nocardioides terrisoli TaxID=3388267 RepID=UPI00287BB8D5|nr:YggT family protein [Nocardioides marmorisolisilvae]